MGILGSLVKAAGSIANMGLHVGQALLGQYKSPGTLNSDKLTPIDSDSVSRATEVLGLIYRALVRARDEELEERNELEKNQKDQKKLDDDRNEELIKALTLRRKAKKKPKKEPTKKEEPKKAPTPKEKGKKPPKEIPKEEVEVPKAPEAPKAPKAPKPEIKKPTAEKPTPAKPSVSKVLPTAAIAVSGAAALIASSLAEAGVSEKGQANVLAQVKAESNFVPKSENLNYSSAERIQKVFGKNRIPSVEFAQQFVNNPESLANYVYAKTDGNSEPGDGWKYRGRGYLQHTGKNQYIAIKKFTGVDVVNNPDLLNTPEVASKAVVWFFINYKKKKPEQLDDISEVNKAVGFAGGQDEASKRQGYAQQFAQNIPKLNTTSNAVTPTFSDNSVSGTKIDQASKENKDMKSAMEVKSQTNVNNTNITAAKNASNQVAQQEDVDDRPPIYKKS